MFLYGLIFSIHLVQRYWVMFWYQGYTALHIACENGHVQAMELLLNHRVDIYSKTDRVRYQRSNLWSCCLMHLCYVRCIYGYNSCFFSYRESLIACKLFPLYVRKVWFPFFLGIIDDNNPNQSSMIAIMMQNKSWYSANQIPSGQVESFFISFRDMTPYNLLPSTALLDNYCWELCWL